MKWHCSAVATFLTAVIEEQTPVCSDIFINTNIYPYIYTYMMVAQWRSLPALMFCCSSSELHTDLSLCYWNCCSTVRNMDQQPQFMFSKSPKALWDLLSSPSGTSSRTRWCINVMRKMAQRELSCAGKVLPMAMQSFCLSSTL